MEKLGRVTSAAMTGAAVVALAACGSGSGSVPGSATARSDTADVPASSPAPSGESTAEVCSDLYAFTAAAGPVFDLARFALADGETPEERRTVSVYVHGMALHGVLLSDHPEMGATYRTVALAAAEAKRKLADGVPAAEAIAALTDDQVTAARETAVAYRGDC
ncbi:hypothetical protein LZG04_02955 [Saccharothrix sp. S26]|uniref:hypothetical protein n=1 Tax=Saccharothrix sp. S26 TaxID=2907215 RepID=UPI001F266E50|nr:hypothetical protein [Saccharothrix sp. S26]MCE6993772.1 hypothetical protein [Saccharothrix sp. S26]